MLIVLLSCNWHLFLFSLLFIICCALSNNHIHLFIAFIKIKSWIYSIKSNSKMEKYSILNNSIRNSYLISPSNSRFKALLEQAEKYKQKGNSFLQSNNLIQAYDQYSKAINLNLFTKNNAIYYSNRAFVSLKLENIGSALEGIY